MNTCVELLDTDIEIKDTRGADQIETSAALDTASAELAGVSSQIAENITPVATAAEGTSRDATRTGTTPQRRRHRG